MSRLPTFSSKLPPPAPSKLNSASGLRGPGTSVKRGASGDEDPVFKSPEKRPRVGISKDDSRVGSASSTRKGNLSVQPRRAGANMRRSVSMSNVAGIGAGVKGKVGGSNFNMASKGASPATKAPRRPLANIALPRKASLTPRAKQQQPPQEAAVKAQAPKVEGLKKRAAWDVKGRLVDMEAKFLEVLAEKDRNKEQFTEYDMRFKALEKEKVNLNQNLQQTHQASQAHQDEVDRLTRALRKAEDDSREECDDLKRQIKALQNKIEDLEDKKSSLERRLKSTDAELATKLDEIVQLKSSISQLTVASTGMEALLSSTKQLLAARDSEVTELKATVADLNGKVEVQENKITEGEAARRRLHNQVQELKGNIRVFCRVRPLLPAEVVRNGDSTAIHHISILDEKTLEVSKGDLNSSSMSGLKNRSGDHYEFSYDRTFGPEAGQEIVFEEISQLVQSALDGYNVCIFAYGQTGSGKTYTMEGNGDDNPETEGMIPRTVKQIFEAMAGLQDKGWNYKVTANFLEIYNETIRDLLAPKGSQDQVHEIKRIDKNTEDVYVTNLTSEEVTDEGRVYQLLQTAKKARATAATNMNERSSRSHSLFQLKLSGKNSRNQETCHGTLSLVDLAGSERLKESGAEGARLTETLAINKSLSNLGNVIMALGQKAPHIPYRNSKLTHLLSSSLGGNSKNLMFINVSPLDQCYNETLNSLRFATKVNNCHIGTATKQR